MKTHSSEFLIKIFCISASPRWYAYQILRSSDGALAAGGDCRKKTVAKKEAEMRIQILKSGVAA